MRPEFIDSLPIAEPPHRAEEWRRGSGGAGYTGGPACMAEGISRKLNEFEAKPEKSSRHRGQCFER